MEQVRAASGVPVIADFASALGSPLVQNSATGIWYGYANGAVYPATVLNAMALGAVANGSTDDYAKVQAAISALSGVGGGELYFPAGTYKLSTRLSVPSNVSLRGASNGSTFFKNTGVGSPNNICIDVRGVLGTAYPINAVTEGSATVTTTTAGNAGNFAAGDYIAVAGPFTSGDYYPLFITKVLSAVAGTGVITLTEKVRRTGAYTQVIKVTSLVENVTIRDINISQAGDVGIFVKYAQKVTTDNCVDSRSAGTNCLVTVGSRNLSIRDNRWALPMGFHSTIDSEVRTNYSYSGLQTNVEGGCEGNSFIGNKLLGMTANGFNSQTQSQRNAFIGNHILNVPNGGVGIQILADSGFGGGNVVSGNILTGGAVGDYGIAIGSGSDNNVVDGNVVIGFDTGITTGDAALLMGANQFVSCTTDVTVSGGAARFLTPASTTGGAGFRLPHGAAPTSPVNGDIWTTTLGLYVRINGATVGPLS